MSIDSDNETRSATPAIPSPADRRLTWHVIHVVLITLVLFLYGGSAVPDVNEAHYLGKAKHFWDPTYCAGDFFIESPDAHPLFFFAFGWITQFVSLPTAAWLGRWLGWIAIAWAWHRLSFVLVPIRGASVLTAGAWVVLIQQTQMSGEWLVGGIEAKVFAYAVVLWALREWILQRWTAAWILLGVASAFHVLVGGWAVVMAAFGWLSLPRDERPPWQAHVVGCFLGGLISLLGLVPALKLSAGVDPKVMEQAAQIYTFQRLPHHLLLRYFPSNLVFRHALLLIGFLILARRSRNDPLARRLVGFCAGATLLVTIGAILDGVLGNRQLAASTLRFYWFRSSDIFSPLAVSLGATRLCLIWEPGFPLSTMARGWRTIRSVKRQLPLDGESERATDVLDHRLASSPDNVGLRPAPLLVGMVTCVLFINASSMVSIYHRNPIPPADWQGGIRSLARLRHWREACRWIDNNLPTDANFLTSTHQQTFKWYAARPEVVSWKDVPQDAASIVEWSRRLTAVRRWRQHPNPRVGARLLEQLRREYNIDYVITGWPSVRMAPSLVPVYRNPYYAVHRFATQAGEASVPKH